MSEDVIVIDRSVVKQKMLKKIQAAKELGIESQVVIDETYKVLQEMMEDWIQDTYAEMLELLESDKPLEEEVSKGKTVITKTKTRGSLTGR